MTSEQSVGKLLLFASFQRVAEDGDAAIDEFQYLRCLYAIADSHAPHACGSQHRGTEEQKIGVTASKQNCGVIGRHAHLQQQGRTRRVAGVHQF